jgi:hypothetical protein
LYDDTVLKRFLHDLTMTFRLRALQIAPYPITAIFAMLESRIFALARKSQGA